MTLKEFRKRVEEAHRCLDENNKGVCDALERLDIYYTFQDFLLSTKNGKKEWMVNINFDDALCPTNLKTGNCVKGVNGRLVYWLGDYTKENLPLRHHFIDVWAGICESEKWYRYM